MQQQAGQPIPRETQQIKQNNWHGLLRKDYIIDGCMFELSSEQVTKLLQSQNHSDLSTVLTKEQIDSFKTALNASPSKALFVKVNGRTPKDLPLISREIHKLDDLMTILHSSEYILEGIHHGEPAFVIIRHFLKQLSDGEHFYEVFVRGGFTIAIGQKYCDHIQKQMSQETIKKILDVAQQIMPAITMVSPKGPNTELNSFLLSLYTNSQATKITSILPYPPDPENHHSIFAKDELQNYYKEIVQNGGHKSAQEKYDVNEGVIPLVRTVTKEQEIKHYDMGEYLMGNEIDTEEKMNEWKEFMKEANKKIQQ